MEVSIFMNLLVLVTFSIWSVCQCRSVASEMMVVGASSSIGSTRQGKCKKHA
jgi:hypothetical protein